MHINLKFRIATLIYLVAAYAIAIPAIALFADLMIIGKIIDIWEGLYSFSELFISQRIIYLKLSGVGAVIGFVYWLFYYSRYKHHDPLDRFFK